MKKIPFLLAAVLATAMSLMFFSCSSDGGGDSGIVSGALTINNPPSANVQVNVINYSGELRSSETLLAVSGDLTKIIAMNLSFEDPSSPVYLINLETNTFSQSGTFLVIVTTTQGARYYDQVKFENGGAIINWNQNYFDGNEYVGGSSGGSLDSKLVTGNNQAWVDCEDDGECDGFIFLADGSAILIYKEDANSNWEVEDRGTWSTSGSNLIFKTENYEITLSYTVISGNSISISFSGYAFTYTKTSVTL